MIIVVEISSILPLIVLVALAVIAKKIVDALIGLLIIGGIAAIIIFVTKKYPKMGNVFALVWILFIGFAVSYPSIKEYMELDHTLENIVGNSYAIDNVMTPSQIDSSGCYDITVVKILNKNKAQMIDGKYYRKETEKGCVWVWDSKENVIIKQKTVSFKMKVFPFRGIFIDIEGKRIFIDKERNLSDKMIYRKFKLDKYKKKDGNFYDEFRLKMLRKFRANEYE